MGTAFDQYNSDYEHVVERSIAFSGLKHDFFMQAKAISLERLFIAHFGNRLPDLIDVGCGVGRLHPQLLGVAGSISGADVSAASIDRAKQDNPGIDYRVMNDISLPWVDCSFDVAMAVCVFHHIPPADRERAVAEMIRTIRPGGLVVLIEHNPFNPLTRLAVARCPFDHDAVLLSASEARGLLARHGLGAIASRHILLLPTRRAGAPMMEKAVEKLPFGSQYLAWGTV